MLQFLLSSARWNLTIADPQNWVALVAFLVTAIIVSQLSGRARQRELGPGARQQDLERLYALSRSLLLSEGDTPFSPRSPGASRRCSSWKSAALFDRDTNTLAWGGPAEIAGIDDKLREVARQGVSLRDPTGMVITAIRLGGAPIGSLAIVGAHLSDTVLQSVTNLAAIGLERARGQAATARAEAARESSELRAAVLDARLTSSRRRLTSMKAAASDLRSGIAGVRPAARAGGHRHRGSRPAAGAGHRRDSDAAHRLRRFRRPSRSPSRGRHRRGRASRVRHHASTGTPSRLRCRAASSIDADRDLLRLALRQLLDNAVKYSPPGSPIEVRAGGNGTVNIGVRNSGPAIPEHERAQIFERFYRGDRPAACPAPGMGLAIVRQIAQAHGGTLAVSSTPSTRHRVHVVACPRGSIRFMSAGRILVVDDDPQIRRVMRVTLTGRALRNRRRQGR